MKKLVKESLNEKWDIRDPFGKQYKRDEETVKKIANRWNEGESQGNKIASFLVNNPEKWVKTSRYGLYYKNYSIWVSHPGAPASFTQQSFRSPKPSEFDDFEAIYISLIDDSQPPKGYKISNEIYTELLDVMQEKEIYTKPEQEKLKIDYSDFD